uniref:Myosin-H heavy chain n=1 Tax=Anthurium amnicola TaxID=1678845 RepID=A0A1D1Z5E1_9ARAE
MVLGLRSKNRKGATVLVDYAVHVQELKPWPPSQSLKSLRSVVVQWENGDRNSGSGTPVAPSPGDGKIVFNESFKLQVTLLKDAPVKGIDMGTFQKNVLELNLYEPRRDKTVKGQHLGSAAIDLAEHGIIKEAISFGIPVNCKRSFRNTTQPVLFLKIQPFEKADGSSSSRDSLSKEVSLDKDDRESVSALMNGEYAEEAEIASFTDDDVSSSHSSLAHSASAFASNASSPPQKDPENDSALKYQPLKKDAELGDVQYCPDASLVHRSESSCRSPSMELLHDPQSSENGDGSVTSSPQRNLTLIQGKSDVAGVHCSLSSTTSELTDHEVGYNENEKSTDECRVQEVPERSIDNGPEQKDITHHTHSACSVSSTVNNVEYSISKPPVEVKLNIVRMAASEVKSDDHGLLEKNRNAIENGFSHNNAQKLFLERKNEESLDEAQNNSVEIKCLNDNPNELPSVQVPNLECDTMNQLLGISQNAPESQGAADVPVYSHTFPLTSGGSFIGDKLKNMKSVRSPPHVVGKGTLDTDDHFTEDVKEIAILEDARLGCRNLDMVTGTDDQESTGSGSDKHIYKDTRNSFPHNKIKELELRVAVLEAELKEAAAVEIGLYSIVAEHGSSAQKVHAPARRLFRLYAHASKELSQERMASSARSAVSGLVLAAKACGNDVPRLTFWLSNSVVLRAMVSQGSDSSDIQISATCHPESNVKTGSGTRKNSSPLRWQSTGNREKSLSFLEEYNDWEDPTTFISALEKIEAWIFSRVIKSVWWQTLTPYMQSTNERGEQKMNVNLKKSYGRKPTVGDQHQANFSIDLWKKAFTDSCERLCPVRAGGHECGCLRMLPRFIMEQCVARLDVAMFNAILRESADEMPTDPVSDPISDSKVLPIPAGKSSFGAGAQLKNAIGNWSRWLTDLFGIDDDDDNSTENENELDDDRHDTATSFKSFHLLNGLSDLLMLPKDMLLNESIRKEVFPTFSASIIKRILSCFEPDDFCPDPIPEAVFQALDSEDDLEINEEVIRNFPCNASPVNYSPPSMAPVMATSGDAQNQYLLRSGSSVLRKCHTSDDELDELDSPFALIMDKSLVQTPKLKGSDHVVRYRLLREVWRDED